MPLLAYCDNNFVVTAHDASNGYKTHLSSLASEGRVTLVLSPWHWREMATDADHARGTSMANFCDSLNAAWFYDRRSVQRREVAAAFYRFAKIQADAPVMAGNIGDIIHDMTRTRAYRKCSAFVEHLRQIGPDHPLGKTFKKALENNEKNAEDFLSGRFTAEMLAKFERRYVQTLLPSTTPSGIAIDETTKRDFLDSYTLTDLPAATLETRITHENWALNRKLSQNNFMDQQHVVAVPYVDFFITNDAKFSKLIKRTVEGVPFRVSEVLTKEEFDARFPMMTIRVNPTGGGKSRGSLRRTKTLSSLIP
jgi:hypothetical protein